ncbi:hypothetical protein [Pueribacillus sp. YX66]|uniref:hypothetical protein n=1 Tax=Pueribacillus sp. YX66 TaxID=3229242 RepID=UPI00358D956F
MKKILSSVFVILVLFVSGCSSDLSGTLENEPETRGEKEVEDVQLQVSKMDEEAGVTTENNEIYQYLDQMVKEDPKMGIPNDFSIHIVDIVEGYDDDTHATILFLGVNRLPKAMKNISFNYTLGTEDGEYMWKGVEVMLSESEVGIIKPNHAVPYSLEITPEQEEIYMKLEQDNTIMNMENFDFELVE